MSLDSVSLMMQLRGVSLLILRKNLVFLLHNRHAELPSCVGDTETGRQPRKGCMKMVSNSSSIMLPRLNTCVIIALRRSTSRKNCAKDGQETGFPLLIHEINAEL